MMSDNLLTNYLFPYFLLRSLLPFLAMKWYKMQVLYTTMEVVLSPHAPDLFLTLD